MKRRRGPSAQIEAFPLSAIVPGVVPSAIRPTCTQADPEPLFAPLAEAERQDGLPYVSVSAEIADALGMRGLPRTVVKAGSYAVAQAHAEGRSQAEAHHQAGRRHQDPEAVYRAFRDRYPHLYQSHDERSAFVAGFRSRREQLDPWEKQEA